VGVGACALGMPPAPSTLQAGACSRCSRESPSSLSQAAMWLPDRPYPGLQTKPRQLPVLLLAASR